MTQVSLYLFSLLELIWNCWNISVTPKMVRKVVMNLYLSKASGLDCIPVVVLKNCEPEYSYILRPRQTCQTFCQTFYQNVWRCLMECLMFVSPPRQTSLTNIIDLIIQRKPIPYHHVYCRSHDKHPTNRACFLVVRWAQSSPPQSRVYLFSSSLGSFYRQMFPCFHCWFFCTVNGF